MNIHCTRHKFRWRLQLLDEDGQCLRNLLTLHEDVYSWNSTEACLYVQIGNAFMKWKVDSKLCGHMSHITTEKCSNVCPSYNKNMGILDGFVFSRISMAGPNLGLFFLFLSSSSFPIPTPVYQFLSFSQHAFCLCVSYQHVSVWQPVSQTGIPEQRAAAASSLFTLLHPSVHPLCCRAFVLFSAAINLLANRQQSHQLVSGFWLYWLLRMLEPESNPPLWGDPQTKNGSFCRSPQIPHLFRMKTKINLMTCIQCGQTVPSFFLPRGCFFLKLQDFYIKRFLFLWNSLKWGLCWF